ncbi:MAG: hypothetical protein IIA66_13910, partial [Planctomycetes bacterium]|nr:hypothetical protein [Planctomycetota bacterium]
QIVNGTSDCGCQSDDECDDGDACTGDTCDDGGCVHTAVDCSGAGDQCNTASCDPGGVEGNCDILTPVADGTLCSDGDACTENDQCTAGNCGGTAVDCSGAGDQCNTASCDPGGAEGNCDILTPVPDGSGCDDGDACTNPDQCTAGSCGGDPLPCEPGEVCVNGECVAEGCQEGDSCDDGDACSEGSTCDADGECVGGTPVDCSGEGDQCNTASCDPNGGQGNCDILTPVPDGSGCDDGDACTENDQCTAGSCGGTAVADGAPCSDGDACTANDQCTAGNCGGTAVDCSGAGNQCNTASCDPNGAEGNCNTFTPVADGAPCSDGDACTENDQCTTGSCGGTPLDCNNNGVPDCQDIDEMTSGDCDGDGVPDECQLPKSSGGRCTEGCASDCDGNGVIDSCDLANCPPDTPSCDDCNVNGTLDGCDVDPLDPDGDGQVSADGNEDGVPDECVEATGTGDWSGDIWGLGGDYPDNDPKNPDGVADVSVTLDGADLTLFADVTVEIPSLRLINAASLDVTQAGDQGDLTIFDPNGVFDGNLLIEGTLNIGGGRVIDAAGTVTIGAGGVYKSIFGFEGPGSGDLTAGDVIVKCGGSLRLEGSMQLGTDGSIILQGSEDGGKGDCTPPDFKAGDDSTTQVGGDFKIEGSASIDYDSSQSLLLGGDFDNQSTAADIFDWSAGGILLNGPLHTIEAAGRERGPCPSGLAQNFAFGSLVLAEDTLVQIVDDFDNQGDGLTACDETVYVDLLEVSAGAILLTEGCRVYFKQLMLAEGGSIPGLGTDVLQILEGCPPDFSNDGTVGAFDLAILLGAWGLCPEPCTPGEPAATCATDLSGDCVTGAFDLALLLGSWGPV